MTGMNKPSMDIPFSTMPINQYIRVSAHEGEVGGLRPGPTPLYRALMKECSPLGWANTDITAPLLRKMRAKFEEADLLRKVGGQIPGAVRLDELMQMKGTDKPAVLGKDEKPIVFTRITTPRYTKDTSELGLRPDLIDKIIIQSGVDMADTVARAFIASLDVWIKKLDPLVSNPLLPSRDLCRVDELNNDANKERTFSLVVHPETIEDGLAVPENVTDIHVSKVAPRSQVYVMPNSMIISYRNLHRPQFWIERTAFMVEFYCWVDAGATLSNAEGLCSFSLPKPVKQLETT